MPEIKNTFTQGKMNKDLDERIVPNGQYRDALNIQVSTSDGSDIGTVQNLLGNTIQAQLTLTGFWECVGSITDEKTDTIYSFITNDTDSGIVQYKKQSDNTILNDIVFCDIGNSILQFSIGDIITGINIIDNLLLWTDGVSEPKKINIDDCILGSTDLSTHTTLWVNGVTTNVDITEEDITVIKKKPLRPLSVIINEASTDVKAPLFEKIFPRFSYRYRYADGEYSAYAPFTDVIFKSKYAETEDLSGATAFYNEKTSYDTLEPYNAAMRNWIESIELYDFVTPTMPKGVVQVDLLYKQENSPTIYILEVIQDFDSEWDLPGIEANSEYKGKFVVKSENIYAALPENQTLRPWDNVPRTALAQEVTGNRVVYGNYTQSYDLTETPKTKIDYEERYTIADFTDGGLPSIKSQRNYQLGVVYGDKYGRETPVFTNSDASIAIPWKHNTLGRNAQRSTQLTSVIESNNPSWASYYKFYVKETSGEYYNLVMDALYNPTLEDLEEDEHCWIAFHSSDRNKISKDDYITLKKLTKESAQVATENKYRVLDVKNEAPDAIKFKLADYGQVLNEAQTDYSNGVLNAGTATPPGNAIFSEANFSPITPFSDNNKKIQINRVEWSATTGANLINGTDLTISFTNTVTGVKSKHKVVRVSTDTTNYYLLLEKQITNSEITNIADVNDSTLISKDVVFGIDKKINKGLEAFSGRFFVKILKNSLIKDKLEHLDALSVLYNFALQDSTNLLYHADALVSTGYDIATGLVNWNGLGTVGYTDDPDDNASITGITDTRAEWQALLDGMGTNRWFIDSMHMVAAQTSDDNHAKTVRYGWEGGNAETVMNAFTNEGTLDDDGSGGDTVANRRRRSSYWHWDQFAFGGTDRFVYYSTDSTIDLLDSGTNGSNLINGLEGVIKTTNDHAGLSGIRQWRNHSYGQKPTDATTQVDDTYESIDKFFIHISFLAPGVDLHDGDWATGVDDTTIALRPTSVYYGDGKHCIWNNMQAISGGGVFTDVRNIIGNAVAGSHTYEGILQTDIFMEMDSLHRAEGISVNNSSAYGYNVGQGYPMNGIHGGGSSTKLDDHNTQWDLPTDDSVFASKLVQGARFKFAGDADNNFYKIINNPVVKKVYNHTPWRTIYNTDGSGGLVGLGNSVEEAARDWAEGCTVSGQGRIRNLDPAKGSTLRQRLKHFGLKNNRRLVYIIEIDKDPTVTSYNPVNGTTIDSINPESIEIVTVDPYLNSGEVSQVAAIWETEPKDNVDLDIYYEASQAYPTTVTEKNIELFAPVGSTVSFPEDTRPFNGLDDSGSVQIITGPVKVGNWSEVASSTSLELVLSEGVNQYYDNNGSSESINYVGIKIRFTRNDGSYTTATVSDIGTVAVPGFVKVLIINFDSTETGLGWYNCFSFGNGIESDRIRDDFNAMTLTNGVRANATLDRPYVKEHRKSGLIYSGLYNSTSGVNSLNQFIMAEKITKDLNPTYGSIQKLFSRRISLIAFCEDKVIGITANKNALYNADGNPQLVATNAVLGDANPFVGDYGISKNPESFAKDSYRAYFTDKQRGAVLRLSMDGLTPISDAGMSEWFKDKFRFGFLNIIGSFDTYKSDYNLTLDRGDKTYGPLKSQTVTYSEDVKGWVSFKSFIQESGTSMSGDYYTFYNGQCYKHNVELLGSGSALNRNTFYDTATGASITFLLNDSPTSIKNFNTLNYDGDENWSCTSIETDQQSGTVSSFIEKEGKWFNYISGSEDIDVKAFNFQGIGTASQITTI